MKIIIISDIKGNAASVIPYGLNLAKYLEKEVLLVHVVDPRVQQGVPGTVADSSSVTPGSKLDHDEVIEKELLQSKHELDKCISYELSRLNYPLKFDLDLSINSIETKMGELADIFPGSVFVMNKEPDGYIFDSQKETIEISKVFDGLCLFVPPGEEFIPFNSVLVPTGFSDEERANYPVLLPFLSHFNLVINLLGRPEQTTEDEMFEWSEFERIFPYTSINYKLLEEGDFDKQFIDYAGTLNPHLVVVMEEKKGFWSRLFQTGLIRKLLKEAPGPVLYYSKQSA